MDVTHDPIEAMVLADRVGMSVEGASDPGKPVVTWTRTGNRTVALHFGQLHHLNRQDGMGAVPAKGPRTRGGSRLRIAWTAGLYRRPFADSLPPWVIGTYTPRASPAESGTDGQDDDEVREVEEKRGCRR